MANTFPTALNDWSADEVIESAWADALETKIGIDGSAVATSIDYLLKNTSSIDPGHKHSTSSISGQIAVVQGGTGASDAATARTNLGLAIGTNVQAYDATLTSIALLGTAADKTLYATGIDTWAETPLTAAGRALIDDADAAAQRTTLGLGTAATMAGPAGTIVGTTDTQTLSSKRINPREQTEASNATPTPTSDSTDIYTITALAVAAAFAAPTGTPVQGQKLIIRITDNGTARALTWNAVFRAMGTALPSTTVLSKTLYLGFIYNATDVTWDLVASAQQA